MGIDWYGTFMALTALKWSKDALRATRSAGGLLGMIAALNGTKSIAWSDAQLRVSQNSRRTIFFTVSNEFFRFFFGRFCLCAAR